MALHKLLNNFTGGELTPQLDARIDLQKYDTGCKRLENIRIRPYGGASFRAGTLFIAETKDSSADSRLIPFVYSTSVAYVIELGAGYMRFYRDGAQVVVTGAPAWLAVHGYFVSDYVSIGGVTYRCVVANLSTVFATDLAAGKWVAQTAYEITAPYSAAEVFEIQFKQVNDVMYLVHPNHSVQKLSRLAETNWTTEAAVFDYPPLLDENATATTLTASGTTGTVTLTASAATFNLLHVGAYFEVRHLREAVKLEQDISGATATSAAVNVKGDWTFTTTERWWGLVELQRSTDGGTVWKTFRKFSGASDRNVSASGFQVEAAQFRIKWTSSGDPYASPPWVGTAPVNYVKARAVLEVAEAYIPGLLAVTGYTSSTVVTASVIYALEATTATTLWSEGAWSSYQGFPRAVGLFEQRLFFAGTARKPTTIWGSVTADFQNFQYGDTDDAAVAYQIAAAQQNPINWIETLERLWAGTSGGEHYVSSGNENEPLTPSNVIVRDPSAYGSDEFQAVKVDKAILFIQRQGKRLRELKEDQDPDKSTDLTVLAEHLMSEGFIQVAYARLPEPYLYAVMANGNMAVMAYMPEQNISGWSRYVAGASGNFKSVAAVPGTPSDVVYVIVRRTINGVEKRYVEVFTAESVVGFQWMHMDSAKLFPGPITTLTGLEHLEGKQVAITAGASGYVIGDVNTGVGVLTVSGGQVTLPQEESFVRVGLFYRGKIEPRTIDAGMANGTSQGRKKRISELVLRFKDTLGAYYGNSLVRSVASGLFVTEVPFRSTEDSMDTAPGLFTGDIPLPWEAGAEFADNLHISQQQPLPMTLLGIFAKMEVFGD